MSPNPPDPSRPLFVGDDDAYRAKFDELMEAAKSAAAREGRPLDSKDINAAASEAAEFSRNTEFSKAATAMIQGDRALPSSGANASGKNEASTQRSI